MAVGRSIVPRGGHINGFVDEIGSARSDADSFFTFFSGGSDARSALTQGAWDFSQQIINRLENHLVEPEKQVALEIGCGGGRLLAHAARHFGAVVGVDVHREMPFVQNQLNAVGVAGAGLISTDGRTLPLASGSIDFVYSFVVMQHMELIEVLCDNLNEISRVLKIGGYAVLYFGRASRLSHYKTFPILALLDRLYEETPFCPRYIERQAKVNETNLLVSARHLRKLLRSAGLVPLRSWISRRAGTANRQSAYGGQTGFLVAKK